MKKKTARSLALLMAAAMTASTFYGISIPAKAAEPEWISDEKLEDKEVSAPKPDKVVPDANQYKYQKDELAAFCHFGPNTFTGVEWGDRYGSTPADELFTLKEDFDAETLVQTLKDAGFKKLIVTAKHHDGFCIWQSRYNDDYDMGNVDYKDGKGDILEEISQACTDANMDMGLYLSPWDVHNKDYAVNVQAYNDYYNNQLEEILSSPKYGNNGHFVEVWMDGANGGTAQTYTFEKWFETIQKYEGEVAKYDADCMLFGAEAYTTVRWIGNENGLAAKDTWSKSQINKEKNTINSNTQGSYTVGLPEGNQWTVPEADARITSGWFWGESKKTPKTITELANMYFNSVGHNSVLLLNVPPNNQGKVDQAILDRVREFGENIQTTFKDNMAQDENAKVQASNVRGNSRTFGPAMTVDNKDNTYWTTEDGKTEGSLLIDLGSSKRFDVVSIEEAIQNGQHINSYKVEYRSGGGAWTILDEGVTIGAKRLIRTGAVRADQIKITVSAPEGYVPQISEVGVFKASKGFELPSSAPSGLDVIDIEDTDTSDGAGFDFGNSKWTAETGGNFVNGTNRWANAGGNLTFKFHGSKFYIVGTKDPKHGDAKIVIDDETTETVSTKAEQRATSQIWYTSPDLDDGDHTVTITAEGGALGIEAAYVINNGGIGMIGIEKSEYTMNEDETIDVKIVRVGGSEGRVSALLTGNPGSAVQGDFDTTAKTVTLGDGETETTVPVTTTRAKDGRDPVESRDFTIVLDTPSTDLILGFNESATVNILDAEMMTKAKLEELIGKVDGRVEGTWTGDYAAYSSALAEAKKTAAEDDPDALDMMLAYQALKAAADAMTVRTQFTTDDPVAFPTRSGEKTHVEAELLQLDGKDAAEDAYVRVENNEDMSNGKWVTYFNKGNKIHIPYTAEREGTYTVTMECMTGAEKQNPNTFTVTGENINETIVSAFSDNPYGNAQEETFDITVNKAGSGIITLTAGEANAPNIDKFTITPKTFTGSFMIDVSAAEGGKASVESETVDEGGSTVLTITPDSGYAISQVMVDGSDVTDRVSEGKYTITGVNKDTNVNVIFTFANYTDDNRFRFPAETEKSKVLEAEHFILKPTTGGYLLQIKDNLNWASGGKYVDGMDTNDVIEVPYYAEKAGTYKVTLTYASGSTTNKIAWSTTPAGLITDGKNNVVATQGASGTENQKRTVEFNVNVTKPGAGVWTFTGPEGNSPRLDKFDIELTDAKASAADKIALEIAIQDGNRKAEKIDAYTADSIAKLKEAVTAAQEVFEDGYATQEEADAAVKAVTEAIDSLEYQTYSITAKAENGGGTVSAETQNVGRGEDVTLTITPDYGYTATKLTINNVEMDAPKPNTVIQPGQFYGPNGTYTISDITEDQDVIVTFEKTGYTEADPFRFPEGDDTATLEAEHFTLFNANGDTEKWRLETITGTESDWTKGGTFINSFESDDRISVPYSAKAGTYEVTVSYSSGSSSNKLVWDSSNGTIESGSVSAGNGDANVIKTAAFDVVVNADGEGVWTFTAPADKSPRIDKFEIKLKGTTDPEPSEEYTVSAKVDGGNGTVAIDPESGIVEAGGEAVLTFTPSEGYKVDTVTINNEAVEVTGNTYTIADITENKDVTVKYALDYYTESNRFYFPTAENGEAKTVQAEHFILQDNNDGNGEIRESAEEWAEGGLYVNWFNAGDSIALNYYAQKAGDYEVTMRYRSGSASNSISWTGDKIADGSLDEVEADSSENLQVREAVFTVTVSEAGSGMLTIAAGNANAPQIDKFDIKLVKETEAETVDKSALETKIDEAKSEAAKTDTYTAESIASLNEAIKNAEGVLSDDAATQEAVDDQITLLTNAVAALDKIPAPEKHKVTAESGINGSITVSGADQEGCVEVGNEITVTVKANEGYVIDTLTAADTSYPDAAGKSSYEFNVKVTGDVAIKASFKPESTKPDPEEPDTETPDPGTGDGQNKPGTDADQNKPDAGSSSGKPSTGSEKSQTGTDSEKDSVKAVQTGDDTNAAIWVFALAAAAAAGGAAIIIRKRNMK